MKKKYIIIIVGLLFLFILVRGCKSEEEEAWSNLPPGEEVYTTDDFALYYGQDGMKLTTGMTDQQVNELIGTNGETLIMTVDPGFSKYYEKNRLFTKVGANVEKVYLLKAERHKMWRTSRNIWLDVSKYEDVIKTYNVDAENEIIYDEFSGEISYSESSDDAEKKSLNLYFKEEDDGTFRRIVRRLGETDEENSPAEYDYCIAFVRDFANSKDKSMKIVQIIIKNNRLAKENIEMEYDRPIELSETEVYTLDDLAIYGIGGEKLALNMDRWEIKENMGEPEKVNDDSKEVWWWYRDDTIYAITDPLLDGMKHLVLKYDEKLDNNGWMTSKRIRLHESTHEDVIRAYNMDLENEIIYENSEYKVNASSRKMLTLYFKKDSGGNIRRIIRRPFSEMRRDYEPWDYDYAISFISDSGNNYNDTKITEMIIRFNHYPKYIPPKFNLSETEIYTPDDFALYGPNGEKIEMGMDRQQIEELLGEPYEGVGTMKHLMLYGSEGVHMALSKKTDTVVDIDTYSNGGWGTSKGIYQHENTFEDVIKAYNVDIEQEIVYSYGRLKLYFKRDGDGKIRRMIKPLSEANKANAPKGYEYVIVFTSHSGKNNDNTTIKTIWIADSKYQENYK